MRKSAVSGTLTISALARAAGVNVETIRSYQRKGLLAERHRPHGLFPIAARPAEKCVVL
jgi:hypothetical protein